MYLILCILTLMLLPTGALAGQVPPPPGGLFLDLSPAPTATNLWYFAATARDTNGLESAFSNEVSLTNVYTTLPISSVVLGWDPSPVTNDLVTNYTVYWGTAPGSYSNTVAAGTNLSATVPVIPPPPSNHVLTVTTTGTNLYRASSLSAPWLPLNRTNYRATNAIGPYYFRGKGGLTNRVLITLTLE